MSRNQSNPDLIKITELLLVPNSFLVAALGTADTNLHRAGVSALGLAVSLLWWVAVHDAFRDAVQAPVLEPIEASSPPLRTRILYWLPIVFSFGWCVSTVMHGILWRTPLGTN